MAKHRYNILLYVFALLIIFSAPSFVLAQEGIPTGKLEKVILELDTDKYVVVSIGEYGRAYLNKKGDLFDTLRGNNTRMKVFGVGSGTKYISIGQYGRGYLNYKSVFKALEMSQSLKSTELESLIALEDMAVQLNNIEVGKAKATIAGNNISVSILELDYTQPIGNISISFSKPIKIIKINDDKVPLTIKEKLETSGYRSDRYYEHYTLSTSFSYQTLASYGKDKSVSITVMTEEGYIKTFKITLE